MNIINIIKGIELLAVEVLLWFIYVPKTLYKIIKDPKWAPGYVRDQLAEKDKFKGYMSPVLLFLAISVVLFVLLDSGLIIAPDYDESSGSFGQRLQGPAGLLFLTLPLYFGLFIELFRKGGLTRSNLLQGLYVQCYYFSPLMLSFFAYQLADQFDWEYLSGDITYLSQLPLIMFLLTLLWFIIIQVNYISWELQYKKWKALGLHLLSYVVIGIGGIFYLGINPEEVDQRGPGKEEKVVLTIPENGEYQVLDIRDFFWNATSNYTIALNSGDTEIFESSSKMKLIHNQVVKGKVKDSLVFTFQGNKGDQVLLKGSGSLLNSASKLLFDTYINPDESLIYTYSEESGIMYSGIWKLEEVPEDDGFFLYLDLPETDDYHVVIYIDSPNEKGFTLGFYRSDIDGNTVYTSSGILMDSTRYLGKSMLDETFTNWIFKGERNKKVSLFLAPTDPKLDLGFNVVNENQESVVPVDRSAIANIIHWLYVLLFGYVIFIGYKGLFRKSEEAAVTNENTGTKAGNIASVIGLVIFLLFILAFIFL